MGCSRTPPAPSNAPPGRLRPNNTLAPPSHPNYHRTSHTIEDARGCARYDSDRPASEWGSRGPGRADSARNCGDATCWRRRGAICAAPVAASPSDFWARANCLQFAGPDAGPMRRRRRLPPPRRRFSRARAPSQLAAPIADSRPPGLIAHTRRPPIMADAIFICERSGFWAARVFSDGRRARPRPIGESPTRPDAGRTRESARVMDLHRRRCFPFVLTS